MAENLNLKTVNTVDTRPFKRLVMTIGELPTSFIESMTYYELLAWFVNYLETVIIPTVNNNAEAVKELQDLFTELKDYVDNYFANLDVQEEIDNKLDDMVEEGTLQEIIADYLNSKAVFGFDTVSDMQSATNLIAGSYARTLGYYTINDGGSALYKVRNKINTDVADGTFIVALDDEELVAEISLNSDVDILQLGAKGDNSFNNASIIQKALSSTYNVIIPSGTFVSNGNLSCTVPKKIYGKGKIIFTNTTDDGLTVGDSIELEGIELNTGSDFTGTVLTYDATLGTRTYPSEAKFNNLVISTNANNNIECLFDFKPDRNYGITLNNIKLGKVSDTRKADYGFRSVQTTNKWINSVTINTMNVDIVGPNPIHIDNQSNVGGSCKNWTFNEVTVQTRDVTYEAGMFFKKMTNATFNGCYLWDVNTGTFPNGKIVFNACRYIAKNGCSEDFYNATNVSPVQFTEAYSGYTTETDNYSRTPLLHNYSAHGEKTKIYPLFFPSLPFVEAVNDIEIFTRYRSAVQNGMYFKLTTRGMTGYNYYYARDIILHANVYNTTPVVYRINQYAEGTVVWVMGGGDISVRCSCGDVPKWMDNQTVTEISTGNQITLAPEDIGSSTGLPQTDTLKYFYNQKVITTF